ncbi:MAG: YesL family protein [Lachnospiraceae bacterium]|nr:YesL family protein [Lachnospiraceae bacterium]
MLSGIFNYDNPVWRFIGKLCDVLILNVLWIICSIPLVTMGASTTAVYYVTLKLVRDEEGPIIRSFFKSFKENLKQATVIWLILLMVGGLLGFDLYFFLFLEREPSLLRTVMMAIFGAFSMMALLTSMYVFPLQARFYNPVKRTFFNGFFMSVRHIFHSLAILLIDIGLPLAAIFVLPLLQPLLFLFGFPLLAFLNSYLLAGIFDQYMPENKGDGREHPLD